MRIDLPCCGFKNCRHYFDGNCTKPSEQGKCEYWYLLHEEPNKTEPHWIPCSERLPEEDHQLGGSGKQFSDNVLISIVNRDDEDAWIYVSHTIDGEWALDLSRYCKVLAWRPLPSPYQPEEESE